MVAAQGYAIASVAKHALCLAKAPRLSRRVDRVLLGHSLVRRRRRASSQQSATNMIGGDILGSANDLLCGGSAAGIVGFAAVASWEQLVVVIPITSASMSPGVGAGE